jgi:hypothetical protein
VEGVGLADVPFRGDGQLVLDERELRESGECSPAASEAVLKAEEAAADAPKVTT